MAKFNVTKSNLHFRSGVSVTKKINFLMFASLTKSKTVFLSILCEIAIKYFYLKMLFLNQTYSDVKRIVKKALNDFLITEASSYSFLGSLV